MTTGVTQDLGRVIAVVLDRAHARFFEVTTAGASELTDFRSSATHGKRFHSDRQGGPGWGEREYHGRVREEEHRHVAGVVERLVQLDRERPVEGFVLAGPGPATAALTRALPRALSGRVIGTAHLSPQDVTAAMIERTTESARVAQRHVVEGELVEAMERGVGRGTGTNGPRETLRALARGQVRTLLVVADLKGAGFRCATSGRLTLTASDCRGEGDPVPIPDLMPSVLDECHRQDATVEVIHDPALVKRIDGFAALLRFAE